MNKFLVILLFIIISSSISLSGESVNETCFYVSPNGDNNNAGTVEKPFADLNAAHKAASKFYGKSPVYIYLRGGKHYITETIRFSPTISGNGKYPIKISNYLDEKPIVSTSILLKDLQWKFYKNGIWMAKVDDKSRSKPIFDQLFVNGELARMARYPNYNSKIRHFNGYASDAISVEKAIGWRNPEGAFVHALHKHEWGGYHYKITGKDEKHNLILDGGFQNNRPMGMHDRYRMVENIFEELDAENEWYYDDNTGILYFYPSQNMDLKTAVFELPQLDCFIEINGDNKTKIKDIVISGIRFEQSLRTFMKTSEPLLRSDWTIYRGGALFVNNAENCTVTDCEIVNVGGNGVFFSNYNRNCSVKNTHFQNIGASAICFVGSKECVRGALDNYNDAADPVLIDTIQGALCDNYPKDCLVENNLIHDIGRVEKQSAGVQISMSKRITVRNNSIYDTARAGINIGDGCWGGHIIEWNDVFDTVLETGDHGAFNSWGRDRFWFPNRRLMDSINLVHDNLYLLDAMETTIIRNNRWLCEHGWDIDLDDGSSNYHIYNNLCLNGGLKLREGFSRVVENNIIVNNSFHPHVWFTNSNDIFRHNIITRNYYPVRINIWGKEVDYNLFPDSISLLKAQKNGVDSNSVAEIPRFIDAARGDFRVDTQSLALKIGFHNFPMNNFGVQHPSLKKIARSPKYPELLVISSNENTDLTIKWRGATLKTLSTEGERSATGMDAARGVLIVDIDENSPLTKAGLLPNDVIVKYNARNIDNLTDFNLGLTGTQVGDNVRLQIFSNQRTRIVNLRTD